MKCKVVSSIFGQIKSKQVFKIVDKKRRRKRRKTKFKIDKFVFFYQFLFDFLPIKNCLKLFSCNFGGDYFPSSSSTSFCLRLD